MMMNGRPNAQAPSTTACAHSAQVLRGGDSMFSLRTCHHHAQHSDMAIQIPGKMPARNSLVMETPLTTPKITNPMLGGITGPMIPAAAISPPDMALSWPALTIIGISSAESAAASATAEPERAERMHAAMMAT
jgi:hypothetical protein